MDFTRSHTIALTPDEVEALLSLREFHEARLRHAHLDPRDVTVEITDHPDALTIRTGAHLGPETLPDQARRFVPDGLSVEIVEQWEGAPGTRRAGTVRCEIAAPPVRVDVALTLVPISTEDGSDHAEERDEGAARGAGDHCEGRSVATSTTRTVNGSVSIAIPLVGRLVEARLASALGELLDADAQLMADVHAARTPCTPASEQEEWTHD